MPQLFKKILNTVLHHVISKLFDYMDDINIVKSTYYNVAEMQLKNRKINSTIENCLKDTISTCKLIILQGKINVTVEQYKL